MAAQAGYESDGVPIDELRACDPEGPGGTQLERCMKVYVPAPSGPHGMVFRIGRRRDGKLGLAYLAFGLRHPARDARQPWYTMSHADGCTRRLKPELSALRLKQLAELGDHPGASHRAAASVCKFADVDGAHDVGVAVAEKERGFVDALAGQKRSAGDRVPEAVINGNAPWGTGTGRPCSSTSRRIGNVGCPPIDLPCELDLSVTEISDPDVLPGQPQ
jgi:hypothetical protein